MTRKLLSLTLLAATFAATAAPPPSKPAAAVPRHATAQAISDPAVQFRNWARLFRSNDVAGLVRAMVPPTKWDEFRLVYEMKKLEPISDKDRADFAEKLAKLTAPDAVDRLMLELEPKLEEARPQLPGALLMAFGAMHVAVNSPDNKLTDEQRAALQSAIPGIQNWASTTDFLSSHTLRQALTLLTDAARRTGISSLDQLKALPVEASLDRMRPMLSAAKQAAQLYGVDLDAIADSLQVDVLEIDGDTARVRTSIMLFGAPVWVEHDLVLIEGRWYGKHAARHWQIERVSADG